MAARWLVGLALGLRQGEALGLWWEDIDLLTAGFCGSGGPCSVSAAAAWCSPRRRRPASQADNPAPGAARARPWRTTRVRQDKERITAGLAVARQPLRVHDTDRDAD